MGFGGISIWQLAIVLVIVVLLFGTKKLRNLGGDLGSAVRGFRKAVSEDEDPQRLDNPTQPGVQETTPTKDREEQPR